MDTPITHHQDTTASGGQIAVLAFALAIAIAGAVVAFLARQDVARQVAAVEEENRPATLRIVKLTAPQCKDCFTIDTAIATLKAQPVTITEERDVQFDSEEGKKLVAEHGVMRVPTYLAFGEVSRENVKSFFERQGTMHGDMFILSNVPPVFIDTTTGKERGRLTATVLVDPKRCSNCFDPLQLIDQVKGAGVVLADEKVLDAQSPAGRALVQKYRITKLPTFLLGSDLEVYDLFKNTQLGTQEKDGTFVLRDLPAPYFDVARGRVVGNVELIMLTDKSCTECYPVDAHKKILASFGMRLSRERTVDIASAEGRQLVRAYKITNVPTILLSPDAKVYTQLGSVWGSVGTVEKSGWHVFRHPELMGDAVYKDLAKNEIVRPVQK